MQVQIQYKAPVDAWSPTLPYHFIAITVPCPHYSARKNPVFWDIWHCLAITGKSSDYRRLIPEVNPNRSVAACVDVATARTLASAQKGAR